MLFIRRNLKIKDNTDAPKWADYLDLHLEFDEDDKLFTQLYDKRDDFNFPIVNFSYLCSSQEEITHRVELEYRLFLSIDSSLYRPKTIFFRGCAKFRPLPFFLNPIWPPPQPNIIKMTITPQVFVVDT